MSIEETVKALRWIAKNDEVVFNAERANIAADQLEQLQAENERLKAEKPVTCGECIYSSWAGENTANDCPMNLFRLGAKFGNTDVKPDDYCSYGERRDTE